MIIPWNLTGTVEQKALATRAFERIKFPFERITLPGTPELGWRNLNGGDEWWKSVAPKGARLHGDNLHDGDEPEKIEGELNGRKYILGVFFPMSARIFIDAALERYPEIAMATIGAEIAHAVDEFLPMTDDMRNELLRLWNVPGTTWWETFDYSEEYYRLGGEAFMHEFVFAYSDLDFGNKSSFIHDAGVEPEDIWRILGIRRTDYVEPAPEPVPVAIVRYGKSKVYHLETHKLRSRDAQYLIDATGLRPCKVCKP